MTLIKILKRISITLLLSPSPLRKSRSKVKSNINVPQKSSGRFRGAFSKPLPSSTKPGPSKKSRNEEIPQVSIGADNIGRDVAGAVSRDVSPKRSRQDRDIRDSPLIQD